MTTRAISKLITVLIALVWLVNGLFCKVLDLVPRHQQIVGEILGQEYAGELTMAIGLAEAGMAVWILSGYKSRFNAVLQIIIIATMNILEFLLVPDFLLWGKANSIFALLFILVIYYNEFQLKPKIVQAT
ncbi:DoxX-like family protein [Flavobacteriaceae bacterium TK19130]|nr:DoxX-like family protein [Thermobacterium salinum]